MVKRCKCETTKYMIEENYFTRTCLAKDVLWADFLSIKGDENFTKHIHFCPFCGLRLPKIKQGRGEKAIHTSDKNSI